MSEGGKIEVVTSRRGEDRRHLNGEAGHVVVHAGRDYAAAGMRKVEYIQIKICPSLK
jgi:hypothetical protein